MASPWAATLGAAPPTTPAAATITSLWAPPSFSGFCFLSLKLRTELREHTNEWLRAGGDEGLQTPRGKLWGS